MRLCLVLYSFFLNKLRSLVSSSLSWLQHFALKSLGMLLSPIGLSSQKHALKAVRVRVKISILIYHIGVYPWKHRIRITEAFTEN